jgi:hypothetical protein
LFCDLTDQTPQNKPKYLSFEFMYHGKPKIVKLAKLCFADRVGRLYDERQFVADASDGGTGLHGLDLFREAPMDRLRTEGLQG